MARVDPKTFALHGAQEDSPHRVKTVWVVDRRHHAMIIAQPAESRPLDHRAALRRVNILG